MNWNKSNTIKLIEYIQKYEQLQQKSMNLNQSDRIVRKKLIRLIAINMKCSEAEIVRKLQNLRCHFYREVQKERNDTKYVPKTLKHKPFVSKWYGYELLKFLKNGYVKRCTRPSISSLRPTNIKTQFKLENSEVDFGEYQHAVSDILIEAGSNDTKEGLIPYMGEVRNYYQDNANSSHEDTKDIFPLDNAISGSDTKDIFQLDNAIGGSDSKDIISLDDSSLSSECGENEPQTTDEKLLKKNEFIPLNPELHSDNALNYERKQVQDEFSVFGEFIASELRSTPGECNQLILKKRIQDLIFQLKIDILRGKEIKYQSKASISMDSD